MVEVMFRLVGSIVIFLSLSACTNLGEKVNDAEVKYGDTQASVIGRLGAATRTETKGEFTVLRYCNTDDAGLSYGDVHYDFVFADNTLIYEFNYTNTKGIGFCSSFFRPINWADVQRKYQRHLELQEEKRWKREIYNIDVLKVTLFTEFYDTQCFAGRRHRLVLEGKISPDSSFAMDRLLSEIEQCRDSNGAITSPIQVSLKSGGGLLKDGYALGKTFREYGIHAVIDKESVCASSCAVAFLGAKKRTLEDTGKIMFHAPYFSGKNEYGARDINCKVGKESLSELKNYYTTMTDKEAGERLFERTMWYCSADDGWVVTGGAAAVLYGIATQR